MDNMQTILNVAQVLLAIAMVAFILVQRGAGATAGSAFGGGASGTVFGARGSASFLTRATAGLAAGFFLVNLLMAVIAGRTIGRDPVETDLGVMSGAQPEISVDAGDIPELPVIEVPSESSDLPSADAVPGVENSVQEGDVADDVPSEPDASESEGEGR